MLKLVRDDFHVTVGFDRRIFKSRIKCQRHAGGNGPWRSGPDDGVNILPSKLGGNSVRIRTILYKFVSHEDRRAAVIFVFDFRFRERRRIVNAPINRLAPAIDVAFLHEFQECAGNRGFVAEAHRQIRIVPLPEDSQPLEIALVLLDIARSEFAAQLAKLRRRHFAFPAELFFHLRFNRQPVAIPSRHVRRIMPRHTLRLDDQVLQDFVQAGAEMNFARGIRRPVVQHKQRQSFASLQNALVNVRRVPGFQLFRLVLRKAGLHGEICLRQVQRLLEFQWFGHRYECTGFNISPV